ncbi:MAG: ester cyclase [Microcoleus sp. SIO2G3]|nr:ester cyclase [Microcoleus sp. SIO2G3]
MLRIKQYHYQNRHKQPFALLQISTFCGETVLPVLYRCDGAHAFPDGCHTFEDVIAEGDKVVTRGAFSGTHQGEIMGILPTGKQVKFSVIHIDRVMDGKVVEHWGQGDTMALMQQLGVVPSSKSDGD